MPIRMVEDPHEEKPRSNIPSGKKGGSGGMATSFLPLIIGLFRKNPKTGMLLVGAGIVLWFLFGKGCDTSQIVSNLFNTGANFDPQKYDNVEVFEPLSDNVNAPLPERVSLEKYAPARMNQGAQGSCVGWGSSYAARTILESVKTGKEPNSIAFSPSYLYNQIGIEGCQGALLQDAMQVMKNEGLISMKQFPYDETDCTRQPSGNLKQEAQNYKVPGFNRLTQGDAKGFGSEEVDMLAMKQNLAQGAPVVIGMMVGGSFMQNMMGEEKWFPTSNDYDMYGFGGHCMTVIGYDDYKFGTEGGFQLMNSWGPEWGKNGLGWVSYRDFAYFTKEAYGIYPMGNPNKPLSNTLNVQFGLMNNETSKNIPLQKTGTYTFATKSPVKKLTKFKLQVTNTMECYTYIFGQETDGSSYVLFPYTEKHSPYCGITGTRLFPKDYSMQVDEVGTKDNMAIVVSKQPLDYKTLNTLINSKTGTYEQKLAAALQGKQVKNVNFLPGETISFQADAKENECVMMVIEVSKN
ncbi:MAG: C1 family peptidase [Chitinophagales bacterium]